MAAVCLLAMFACVMQAQTVSVDNAAEKAVSFFNTSVKQSNRKMATRQNVTLHHTAKQGDETYFYIFNKAEGGWVIVGGDEVCHDIIAFSDKGTFNYDNAPSNLRNWLKGYEAEISHAISATTEKGVRKVVKETRVTASAGETIEAMIQTHWDQGAPYWNMCPIQSKKTCYTGCVATAMAQVMYYWQWPKVGVGSHSYYDNDGCKQTLSTTFSDHTYDWANMKLETSDYTTTAQKDAVAQLMYDCGVSVDMMYTNDGSGAYSEDIPGALTNYFSYQSTAKYVEKSSYSTDSWVNLIYAELAAGRPVLYAGADGVGSDAGGHQFICDGYKYSSSTHTFHFNWGWSGEEDGFFTLTTLGKSYNFKYYQDAVIGIQPKEAKIYTVTLADDDSELKPSVAGSTVALPSRSAIAGYTFLGWANNGGLTEPTTTKPTIVSNNYTPVKDVTLYPVYSYVQPGEGGGIEELINEDFSETNKSGDNTSTGGSNALWSGNDNFSSVSYAFKAGGAVRIGTSKNSGYIQADTLDATSGQKMTVQFDVKGWSSVEGKIVVSVTGCSDQTISYTATMSDNFQTKSAEFTLTSNNPTVTIATSKKRAFIDNVIIIAGGSKDKTYYTTWGTYSDATMKITPAKWATFYAPFDVTLDNDVYAYAVTSKGSDIQRVYVADGSNPTTNFIPAHTPVLVYKDVTETYSKTYQESFSTIPSTYTDNCLIGSVTAIAQLPATTGDNTNYVLQLGTDKKPTWFTVIYDDTNEKYNSLEANHAYLSIPAGTSVKDIFADVATEIVGQRQEMGDKKGLLYNLQGQVVDSSFKGIIIQNGKKILSK